MINMNLNKLSAKIFTYIFIGSVAIDALLSNNIPTASVHQILCRIASDVVKQKSGDFRQSVELKIKIKILCDIMWTNFEVDSSKVTIIRMSPTLRVKSNSSNDCESEV